ncbi:MAG: ribosome small subunit-dependent GTPase A [Clostridium sulfidigenes]|uniref:Small ribosomal subunit biogenesis GTPase RsgA n=1 Tax=Clostridium sulfidigenes TaxID=318464 RepID=A0A927WDT9_9CLOT|nr:ribosome small subunit-dependent GTPase A [Clostridium sulfidigenes]
MRENKINEYSIGRVYAQHRNLYKIITEKGEISATLSGKLQYELINKKDYPVVGDWVNYEELGHGEGIIHQIQGRKTLICRKVAGVKSEEQALAANIDKIFITMSLNNNFNLRRLERYINIAWDSGATPVILLTKLDLCEDLEDKLLSLDQVALGIDKISVSSLTGEGVEVVRNIIKSDDTVVFIGSSGVGKSTIINKLLEKEVQITKEVDEYDKGRHTTTHRELFVLPTGGAIIDTPGMRELQLSQGDVEATFKDIEDLALKCHFSDCKHKSEPKCAVQQAIERGELSKERFISYEKIKKEIANEEKRRRAKERINERKARIRR